MGCNCGGGRSSSVRSPQGVPQTYRITHPNGAASYIGSQTEAERQYRAYRADPKTAGAELHLVNAMTNTVDPSYRAPED